MANAKTTEKVTDLLLEIFPQYEINQEFQNCISIKDKEDDRIFWFGQTNENWGADVYADAAAMESGEIEDSIETLVSTKSENATLIADALITAVRQYQ